MNFKIVMFWIISLTILLLLTIGASSSVITNSKSGVPVTTHCEYYNETNCINGSGQGCYEKQECSPHESGKRNHCFVVWHVESDGKRTIKLKGCFLNSFECYNKTECVEKSQSPNKSYLFCCCEGDMCNQNFTWDPSPTEPPKLGITIDTTEYEEQIQVKIVMVYVLILILAVIILIGGVYWFYGPHRLTLFMEIPTDGGRPTVPSSPRLGVRPIQLIEVKARGRYGAVWKAQYKTEEVAVKIFPIQDKQSWISEQEIYQLPRMSCHPNILQYIGAEKRGDNLHAEFWLITAYHEKGSLCDFLKSNVLTWSQLCRIAETMSRGLMFLHEEIPANKTDGYKPAIAHRDFKSKNVLLKSDLTACIADFGLALIFHPGQPCGDTHGQVGTRRYMAPEVLEGAINFTRDSFLRIDMYACGLVLWELASRCSVTSATLKEYHLPLEEEVGQLPTLEDMQEAVVQRKVRPTIKAEWRMHPGISMLCDTMEECWDHDAEARLSASCVMERIAMQSRFSGTLRISDVQQQQQQQQTDTLNVAILA